MSKNYVWASGPMKLVPTPAYLERGHEQDSFTAAATQMVKVHNAFTRGFNTMWHLAPKVPKSELKNFVGYCYVVCKGLHNHHGEEEEHVFPAIEKISGETGIMNQNIQQHEAFHEGFTALIEYLEHLLETDPTQFDTAKFRTLFNSFSKPLEIHLEAEIQTLLDLRKYASKGLDLMKLSDEVVKRTLTMGALFTTVPSFMQNHDRTYEDSYSNEMFPAEIPGPMSFVLRKGFTCWNWGYWKFAACTTDQMPRELPYMDLPDRE